MKPLIIFMLVAFVSCNSPIRIVETYSIDSTGRVKKVIEKYYDTTRYAPVVYPQYQFYDPFYRPWYYNNRTIIVTPRPRKK